MKILIDMKLSPIWVGAFASSGIDAVHWSSIGAVNAEDTEILEYARSNGYIVFTHDLDFGTILALTHAAGPSVIQVRTQDILPSSLGRTLISVLHDNEPTLDKGALIVVDETRARIRILPLERNG